jgi:hypothetical protein
MRSEVYVSRFLRAFLTVMLVVLLLTGASLLAQERFSTLNGVVYDSSKAVLQGAEVTITNLETQRTETITTGDNGRYQARDLTPGRYSVAAQKSGFSKSEYPDVILLLGKTSNLDFTLQVGQVAETIVVSGSVAMIDTNTTAVTHNVTSDEFDYMPKGRSFQSVALTAPSVNSGDIEGGIQVNGASGAENQFTVDGISTTSVIDGSSRQDAQFEYLQEVQVKTSGIDAEYGGALGGVISAVTKSGGNQYHGEFHWYNSGSPFNANPNLRLETATPDDGSSMYIQDEKYTSHINEVGGSVGGYIIKDKLFFFTSYSPQFRSRNSTVNFSDGPSTFEGDDFANNLFNKISWDATKRIRANFAWLYTTFKRDGTLPGYDAMAPNSSTSTAAANETLRNQGYYIPKNNYTGTVDITLSNTSLLSLRGGYFWDNYKDLGVPDVTQVRYNYYEDPLMIDIPAEYQQYQGWYNVPLTTKTYYDLTSRAYFQADYSQSFRALGSHYFKAGVGFQKNINTVKSLYQGGGYNTAIYWDTYYDAETDRGAWGYYRLRTYGDNGSAGSGIYNLYAQDQWRIHPRLTLNLGLRAEKENIPSMRQDIQKYAIQFGWGDKLAPRLGASFDVLGNGKWKIYGSWGLLYDWTKYELVRGSFGGTTWKEWYHALDEGTDIYSLSPTNTPGRNLLTEEYMDYRVPSFGPEAIDPDLKPMRQQTTVIGTEFQLNTATVIGANWIHSRLNRTIEDIGNQVYDSDNWTLGNPGEGLFEYETFHVTRTPDFEMPKPKREYDALQITFSRRFSQGWYLGANYTYSRLFGNYSGLSDTDEIQAEGWGGDAQSATGSVARTGTNTALFYDSETYLLDSQGNYVEGRLATDRPHVFKAFGSYSFKWGTGVSANYYVGSGTPMTTLVETIDRDPVMVNNRGDMGRTPVLSYTDLMVSQEFKIREGKTLRFEFNMMNVFNQKTVRHVDPLVNRFRTPAAGMDLGDVNLLNGFNWQQKLAESGYASDPELSSDPNSLDPLQNYAINPKYNQADLWNTGFTGRFGVKFIF